MTNKTVSPRPRVPEEDIRDLLARLYREIGISAVAAALEVTSSKPDNETKSAEPGAALQAGSGKDLAA
ncbi:MAG: hypothetical protein WCF20_00595 [Methylovirgula sp.]